LKDKVVLITGGNSGIGLESARQLTALGHQVVLLGRDARKGERALAELKSNPGRADFLAADLSTHVGVRAAARTLLAGHERFDVLLHCSGVLMFEDIRTVDGLHPFFAVNFLSRYHLTQLLLPLLRKSESPRVIMLASGISLDTRIDFDQFPKFTPFEFNRVTAPIQFGNYHYAAHLRDVEKGILSAVVNAGVADTGIWREMPVSVRTSLLEQHRMNSVPESAKIPVALSVNDGWESGSYWGTLGKLDHTPLRLDVKTTERLISICRNLTGA
jgi:NAD(P)-dependent dehydrogenase (short-subunit alcohol dehydrogenase family)